MGILTISRQFGSGGREIGQACAETMHYEYIDRKRILEDMSKEGKTWEEKAKHSNEYDMVLDTSIQGQDEIVSILKRGLLEKDKLNTQEARQALELRALAEKIKAAVLTDPRFSISALDVDPSEEGLAKYGFLVQGLVHRHEDVDQIEEVVKKMAGDMPVEFRVSCKTVSRFGRLHFT